MGLGIRTAALAAAMLLGATPAMAMSDEDVAGALGMLWRVREGVCPKMRLDADQFTAQMQSGGMKAADLRKRQGEAFDQGYATAGEWLAEGGSEEYCKAVRQLFDGKSDFFGNPKAPPDPAAPGLTFLD